MHHPQQPHLAGFQLGAPFLLEIPVSEKAIAHHFMMLNSSGIHDSPGDLAQEGPLLSPLPQSHSMHQISNPPGPSLAG